jgi:ribosomal protein S18 acetylase RimI-like enzyme
MDEAHFSIAPVRASSDLKAVIELFRAYAAALGVDLSYQDFAGELATMPGKYAAPLGELLLARDPSGTPLACVGLRPLPQAGCCEMKRLYVLPEGRGLGLGRALVDAVVRAAIGIGYREMRLDTLPTLAAAISLYEKAGFERMDPYYDTPLAGTIFMRRYLDQANGDPNACSRPTARSNRGGEGPAT